MKVSPIPLDIRAFLLDLKDRMSAEGWAARIPTDIPEGLPRVLADPNALERIMMNLLTNAFKYSAPHTKVTITVKRHDDEIVTIVSDRGPGIPQEMLPHLFERFYRTTQARERKEGLGLGLYITKGLVEAHGGRIWVESQPGEGSTFYFTLPAQAPKERRDETDREPRPGRR